MKIPYVMPNILHPTIRGERRHDHFLKRLSKLHEITPIALTQRRASRSRDVHARRYRPTHSTRSTDRVFNSLV